MSAEHPSLWNDVVRAIEAAMKEAPPPVASSNAVMRTKIYDRLHAAGYLTKTATQAAVEEAVRLSLVSAEERAAQGGCFGATPPFAVYETLQIRKLVQTP